MLNRTLSMHSLYLSMQLQFILYINISLTCIIMWPRVVQCYTIVYVFQAGVGHLKQCLKLMLLGYTCMFLT